MTMQSFARSLSIRIRRYFPAVIVLALGMGLTLAAFAVLEAVVLHPFPFEDGDRLVRIWETDLGRGLAHVEVSVPNFLDWRRRSQSFQALAAYAGWSGYLLDQGEPSTELRGHLTTCSFFQVFPVGPPQAGRYLDARDCAESGQIAVISARLAGELYGEASKAVGSVLRLEKEELEIIGVAPRHFRFEHSADVWRPLVLLDDPSRDRQQGFLYVVAHLAPGVPWQQAQSELSGIAASLAQEFPQSNRDRGVRVLPLAESLVGDESSSLWLVLAAAIAIFLVSCCNAGALLLAENTQRAREMALRSAMGAGSRSFLAGTFQDALFICTSAGLLALPVATAFLSMLRQSVSALYPGRATPHVFEQDGLVLLLILAGLTCLITWAFFIPLWRDLRMFELSRWLASAERPPQLGHHRRHLLVGLQLVVSVLLLLSAGLMSRSWLLLQVNDPGFAHDGLVYVYDRGSSSLEELEAQIAHYQRIAEASAHLPMVNGATVATNVPGTRTNVSKAITVSRISEKDMRAQVHWVQENYFSLMRIPVLAGRAFDSDDGSVAIVSEMLAAAFGSPDAALREKIQVENGDWREIVGVVGDVRHRGPLRAIEPEVYLPIRQANGNAFLGLLTLARGYVAERERAIRAIEAESRQISSSPAKVQVRSLSQFQEAFVARPRFLALLIDIFAVVAFLATCLGIFSTVRRTSTHQLKELAIRRVLGATWAALYWQTARPLLKVSLWSLVLGLVLFVSFSHHLASQLYAISPLDSTTFLIVVTVFFLIVAVTSIGGARRAIVKEPSDLLRIE